MKRKLLFGIMIGLLTLAFVGCAESKTNNTDTNNIENQVQDGSGLNAENHGQEESGVIGEDAGFGDSAEW